MEPHFPLLSDGDTAIFHSIAFNQSMGRGFLPFGSLELNQVRCLEPSQERRLVPVKESAGLLSGTDLHPALGGPLGQVTEKKLRVEGSSHQAIQSSQVNHKHLGIGILNKEE